MLVIRKTTHSIQIPTHIFSLKTKRKRRKEVETTYHTFILECVLCTIITINPFYNLHSRSLGQQRIHENWMKHQSVSVYVHFFSLGEDSELSSHSQRNLRAKKKFRNTVQLRHFMEGFCQFLSILLITYDVIR